jgi:hypothetical protein
MKGMRRFTFMILAASVLALVGVSSPAHARISSTASAPRASAHAVPHAQFGKVCKNIRSRNNWAATVCAIRNYDDLRADQFVQGLYTFSIRSGSIKTISATGMYLHRCFAGSSQCDSVQYTNHPRKNASGRTAFLSTGWTFIPGYIFQARINTPCVTWTNGQVACYRGVLGSTLG